MLRYTFLALAAMLALASCTIPGTPAPQPTPALPTGQQITIETPAPGASIGSPIALRGSISIAPIEGNLTYRLFDGPGNQLATGPFAVAGAAGRPARYETQIAYPATAGGPGRIEVVDLNSADGSLRGIASVAIILQPAGTAATAVQPPPTRPAEPTPLPPTAPPVPATPVPQAIMIDTPPPGTIVGSPLDFNLPPAGGPIRLELFDQNAGTGVIVANTALDMYVQPPQPARQEISIDTPPPGTLVGSPVVITGRTTLYPFEARLSYRVRGPGGQVLGEGGITVNGAPGQSTTFVASIDFRTPPGADTITIEIFEPSRLTGGIRAIATIDLRIAPQPR